MEKTKKPSKFFAILFTVSAVFSLITLILMIVGHNTSTALITFQLVTVLLLLVGAVGKWYQYTQNYVKYEVERRMSQEEKNNV